MEDRFPVVTFILLAINLAVFLFSYKDVSPVITLFGLSPNAIAMQPYTLITHMFVHADIMHFAINMLMFFALGLAVENKIGSGNFLLTYFFSGLSVIPFVSLIMYVFDLPGAILIGSSGAIFGIMFAAGAIAGSDEVPAVLVPGLNILAVPFYLVGRSPKVPLFIAIIFFLLMSLVLMFWDFFQGGYVNITEFGHFGGLIGGIVSFFFILPKSK